jgi:hypothetical protein
VEWRVLSLILILLVVWLLLGLLLAAWTLFFQGYIYSEPVSAIYWRAPAAAAAIMLFLGLWIALDYRSIDDRADEGRYQPLQNLSYKETEKYQHLWIFNSDGKEEHYELRGDRYLRKDGRPLPTTLGNKILASHEANGDKHIFEAKRDAKGIRKVENGQVRYYEKGNESRYMDEKYAGQISTSHLAWLVVGLLLNFGLFIVWFVSLWLLLRFQWAHALGLAFVFWLILLFILPIILTKAESVRKERLPPKTAQVREFLRICSRNEASGWKA